MQIFCRGFNLYHQLGSDQEISLLELIPTLKYDQFKIFHINHTFSLICTDNSIKMNSKLSPSKTLGFYMGKIQQTTSNDQFVVILTEEGRLFKSTIVDWIFLPIPNFIEDNDKIKIVSSNAKLTVVCTERGFVYNIPEKLDFFNMDIVDAQTGREHCVLLDKLGNAYTFGSGSRGQLGLGTLDDEPNPVLVQALAGITIRKIAAGGWHSAAISQDGDLYLWGWNGNGQLGLRKHESIDDLPSVLATPVVVDIQGCSMEENVVHVACGSKHTIVLMGNNKLYGCGWNEYRQLTKDDQEQYYSFIFLHDFCGEKVERLLCGPWNSAIVCK